MVMHHPWTYSTLSVIATILLMGAYLLDGKLMVFPLTWLPARSDYLLGCLLVRNIKG